MILKRRENLTNEIIGEDERVIHVRSGDGDGANRGYLLHFFPRRGDEATRVHTMGRRPPGTLT